MLEQGGLYCKRCGRKVVSSTKQVKNYRKRVLAVAETRCNQDDKKIQPKEGSKGPHHISAIPTVLQKFSRRSKTLESIEAKAPREPMMLEATKKPIPQPEHQVSDQVETPFPCTISSNMIPIGIPLSQNKDSVGCGYLENYYKANPQRKVIPQSHPLELLTIHETNPETAQSYLKQHLSSLPIIEDKLREGKISQNREAHRLESTKSAPPRIIGETETTKFPPLVRNNHNNEKPKSSKQPSLLHPRHVHVNIEEGASKKSSRK